MAEKSSAFNLMTGIALGGGLMFMLDPGRGKRRRALLRDKTVHAAHLLRCSFERTRRDLGHRAGGTMAEFRSAFVSGDCEDDVLVQRVRARLGRICSHPNSVDVQAEDGCVILNGPILTSELNDVLDEVRSVRGVREVEDHLERHATAGDIPGLQGGSGRRSAPRFDLFQSRWAPATRFLAGVSGTFLLVDGLRRRGLAGVPEGFIGMGMITRAASNLELRRLFGFGATRSAIRMQKTINIHAPVEEVFRLCSNPENFARFMAHVQEVRKSSDGRYHWTITGPAGVSLSWDSQIVQQIPNRLIAWRTVPGSVVRNAGIMRFEAQDSFTRVHILMSYNPPGGALGHVLATIMGSDPKAVMDEDLARMKSLLEVGKTRAHGERITREQISA